MPGLAPSLASTVPELVESCRTVTALLPAADRVVLLTSGPRLRDRGTASARATVVHAPGTPVPSAPLTAGCLPDLGSRLAGARAPRGGEPSDVPGVGVIVGAALLADAGIAAATTAIEIGTEADPALDAVLAAAVDADRVVLLVVAEGSAARGADSPAGSLDEAARKLDTQLANALVAGDPAALAAAVRNASPSADALLFTGGPALRALAGLTMHAPPTRAKLLFDQAPLGVGYLVASWAWE